MLDDVLVQTIIDNLNKATEVSILIVLDDALVLVKFDVKDNEGKVSILVVLDDALVRDDDDHKTFGDMLFQSLLCWTML